MEDIRKGNLSDIKVFCKHCGDENKHVPANGLCRECEEHMCIACFGNHKKYKVCKDHIMIDINTKGDTETLKSDTETLKSDTETVNKEETIVSCPKHVKEQIKFYCTCHAEVGCGDCMILYHKSCKVDYIADVSNAFLESPEYKDTVEHVEAYQSEVNEFLESIQTNNVQLDDIHQEFISEMKSFRDKLVLKLDELERQVLEKENDVHEREKHRVISLETECKELHNELTQAQNRISEKCTQTQLFINTVQSKRAIKEIQQRLTQLKSRSHICKYNFKSNENIEHLFKEKELGGIHFVNKDKTPCLDSEDCTGYEVPVTSGHSDTISKDYEDQVASAEDGYPQSRPLPTPFVDADTVCPDNKHFEDTIAKLNEKPNVSKEEARKSNNIYEDNLSITESQDYDNLIYEEIPQSRITRRRSSSKRKSWSLFENQMRSDNILMAGDIISSKDSSKGDIGLFVGKKSIKAGTYFEVEIINTTDTGNISIGFVPKDCSPKEQPGEARFSIGYHSGDGCMRDDAASRRRISPPCKNGDVIGIGVSSYLSNVFKTNISIFITRNSQKIGSMNLNNPSFCKMYPAVGLKAVSDKVRVVMDAALPQ